MRKPRLVLLTVLALALAIVYVSNVFGQTYKRHALIEEGTGTWCQYCAWGGWEMDSIEKAMKENVVEISWHGPGGNYGEPMWIPQSDSMNLYYPISSGYPWAVVGRSTQEGNYAPPCNLTNNPWYVQAKAQAAQAPIVDFRIVNAIYNSSSLSVDFDVDVTPFDVKSMPTEDTTTYVIVALLAENGIVQPQVVAAYGSTPAGTDDNYMHFNVARALGSKVLGDLIKMGTNSTVAWPVRKHYHISANKSSDWVQDSMKIKAFVARKAKTGINGESYLDANQSAYITTLPTTATRSVWTVLPRTGDNVGGTTTPIVWGRGGGAAANAKIEYSIDNGATWTLVSASAPTSPYQWTIPDNAFGASVKLRVTDAQDASVTTTTGVFTIAPKPYFTVDNPKANDTLWIGEKLQINWTSYNGGENDKLEYSTDGSTWTLIANASAVNTYAWTVPAGAAGSTVTVRVSDGNGAQGVSGTFAVVPVGTITTITIDGGPNFTMSQNTAVHWTATGYLGKTLSIQIQNIAQGGVWQGLSAQLNPTLTQAPIQMPGWLATQTKIKLLADDVGAIAYSDPFDIALASGVAPGQSLTGGVRVSPDPLSSVATVSFTLDEAANTTLTIRDLLGREVLRLTPGTLAAGVQSLTLDASKLPIGTYTYGVLAGHASFEGKLVIVR